MAFGRRAEVTAYAVLIAVALARVAATYHVFAQVVDEPAHVAAGYEWVDQLRYTIDLSHPPLARIVFALPLWLANPNVDLRGANELLLTGGRYEHNLALARSGNLLFLAIAIVAVALWARRALPRGPAFLATAFFASLPPVLAHAGLATTDMAACATFALAMVALLRWFDAPTRANAVLLGVCVGIGAASKLSFVGFFGLVALVLIAMRRPRLHTLIISTGVAALIVCAVYRFNVDQFILGFRTLRWHTHYGHRAYLFGQVSDKGWWYYFPVVLVFKTPLPFLALIPFARKQLVAAVAALGVLAVAMPTPINIGIRHVLPMFAPMAILAADGAYRLWQDHRVVAAVLSGWMFIASALAHPDYLPYYNELALGHGERIAVDSNFDWGQDVLRLRRICREEKIESLHADIFTSANLDALGLPPHDRINKQIPTSGWHAVSEMMVTAAGGDRAYPYLTRHRITRRAGKSIRLYNVR